MEIRTLVLYSIGISLLLTFTHALPSVLIFTKVSPGAYVHESIPYAVEVITTLGQGTLALNDSFADPSLANANAKWTVVQSNDDSLWDDDAYLNQYDAVAFVMTNDIGPTNATSVFSNTSADAFARYIERGGGYVGFHSASATAFLNPFYGHLVGAFFQYHPEIQPVGIKALNTVHPSTTRFPKELNIDEEVYHFLTDPRAIVGSNNVLLTNSTPFMDPQVANTPQLSGPAPRPLAWFHEGSLLDQTSTLGQGMDYPAGGPNYSGGPGRSWYTSLGHANETWSIAAFQGHVLGGLGWVLASSTVKSNNATALVGQSSSTSTSASGSSNSSNSSSSTPSTSSSSSSSSYTCHCKRALYYTTSAIISYLLM